MKVVSLWSGGKDSCFAYYRALSLGYEVLALFNFLNHDGKNSLSHSLPSQLIFEQAKMTGLPIIQRAVLKEKYEQEFKALIREWKREKDIKGIIFGDIYLQEHKDWIDRVCSQIEVEAIMPLWGRDTRELIDEFVKAGFEAILIATNADFLGEEWLKRQINEEFIKDMEALGNIDLCGEKGEYHTFVFDGPIFKEPAKFTTGRKIFRDKHYFLEMFLP